MSNFQNNFSNEIAHEQISKEYHIYFLFVSFLISLQLICNTIEPIVLSFGFFKIPASAIFYVLSFAISDVITENFGFKLAVRATVFNIISQLIYCGIATLVFIILNTSQMIESNRFFPILHFLSFELLSSIISLLIAMTFNDYLINKLKLIFLGKGFLWRTIVSTISGEFIMLSIDYNITFLGQKDVYTIQKLILFAMIYKVCAAIILAPLTAILSNVVNKKIFYLKPKMNNQTKIFMDLKNAILLR